MSNLAICANTGIEEVPFTQYTNFHFNSLTVFNGKIVCGNNSGLFTHETSLDVAANIDAWFEIESTDYGILNQKRLRAIIGSGKFSGGLTISVKFDDGTWVDYPIITLVGMKQSAFKRYINRVQKGHAFKIKVANVLGSDFSIDALDGVAVTLHNMPTGLL